MTPMFILLVAWGILTGILIILWIYKSTLTMHEDDSIFLNESESQMHKDQVEVLAKMKKITPILKVLGALSGVMILVIAGLFVYQGSEQRHHAAVTGKKGRRTPCRRDATCRVSTLLSLGGLCLHPLYIREQHFLVALWVHFFIDFANDALRINHERGTFPEFHALPFCLAKPESRHQVGVCVGEQFNRKRKFVREVSVRGDVVSAYSEHFDSGSVKISLASRKRFALDCASWRIVFRIEINYKPLSGKVGKLGNFAVLIGKRKIGKLIASREHRENSFREKIQESKNTGATGVLARHPITVTPSRC